MGRLTKVTLLFLLLVLPLYAEKATMPVPAVVMLGGGELVKLEVEIREGDGQVYVSTEPLVGIQTEDSARTAFIVACGLARVHTNRVDALISLRDSSGARSVDGPSGGAAMTLLMLSLLENKTIRKDITVTGTILEDGSVGEVGEVGKKTKAAVAGGMKAILIPKNYDVFDKMVFSVLGGRWNISIIEVGDIEGAAKLAFSAENATLQSNVMEVEPTVRAALNATELNCTGCHIAEFKALARSISESNRGLLEDIKKENRSEFSYFIKAMEVDLNESDNAENWNYVYSGANQGFLTSINLKFLKNSNVTYDSLRSRMANVESCIKSAKRPNISEENFEWVVGGSERLAWSRKKLREIAELNYSQDDEETTLFLFKELLHAETWCEVSHEMFFVAEGIGGTPVNESLLKGFASSKIAEADSKLKSFASTDFGDAEWRFEAAKEEFNNSSFAAAIFDSEYLVSTIKALNETVDSEEFLNSEFNTPRSWDGMWAALYGNHAEYIYLRSKGVGGVASSVMLRIYANSLDNDTVRMRELFQSPAEAAGTPQENAGSVAQPIQYQNELALLLVICLIIAIFLNLIQVFRTAE